MADLSSVLNVPATPAVIELSSSESHADPSALGGSICTEIDTLIQKYRPKPLYPAQAGPSGTRQQDDTSRAVSVVPPYAEQPSSLPTTGPSSGGNPKKRPRYSSDADTEGTDDNVGREHAVLRRQVAEMFSGLGKRMDAMNEEMQETKQELLETKQALQATRVGLQAATQELQATKQAFGQELSELKAKMDQEALRLYRFSGQNAELFMNKQTTVEEFLCESVELLKGVMELVSQMMGKEGGDQARTPRGIPATAATGSASARRPRIYANAPAAGGVGHRAGDSAPPTRARPFTTTTATTTATTDTASSRRPHVSPVDRATDSVLPPHTHPPFTTTAATTAPAESSTDSDPASITANPADSSTDSYPASPIVPPSDNLVPPPRTLPFPRAHSFPATTTNNPADSSTDSDPTSPVATSVPAPRTLPFPRTHSLPTTINLADFSSTDSDPASPGPASSVAILEPLLSPDEIESSDGL
ncbi:hypothetical protein VM1G_06168 [Cytospora mali]|uniref:Uncharacterized protein n=1 Tax=Cytospora mali TaxID=578113 RepID=A0A194W3Y5_CYTMA|nr:hypothetical protein VM1G_06168 [Valsa mali]